MLELAIATLIQYFPNEVRALDPYTVCEVFVENDFQDENEDKVKDACLYILGVTDGLRQ